MNKIIPIAPKIREKEESTRIGIREVFKPADDLSINTEIGKIQTEEADELIGDLETSAQTRGRHLRDRNRRRSLEGERETGYRLVN